jgi:acyl dehydratase
MKLKIGETYIAPLAPICQALIDQFAGLTGDVNPIHIDPEEASKSIFGGIVAHGMLVASLVGAVLGMRWPGPGTIYKSQSAHWHKPVRPGDSLLVELRFEAGVGTREAHFLTKVRNQHDEVVMTGKAVVLLPKGWIMETGEILADHLE